MINNHSQPSPAQPSVEELVARGERLLEIMDSITREELLARTQQALDLMADKTRWTNDEKRAASGRLRNETKEQFKARLAKSTGESL